MQASRFLLFPSDEIVLLTLYGVSSSRNLERFSSESFIDHLRLRRVA